LAFAFCQNSSCFFFPLQKTYDNCIARKRKEHVLFLEGFISLPYQKAGPIHFIVFEGLSVSLIKTVIPQQPKITQKKKKAKQVVF